ncbi:putative exported protein [Halobacteriovorax marinus SJ]|uniref:Exported protein n=1 Tax=Halobacteriovorax marinus (strain ATCC BAA-682 / DSM 15412 / SJ) TaxID=862908 RepID=E1X5Z5_HALMS|nr:MBL fold metallo-hydrolase [Halobacteriovorax marinus]CBW25712.1 putative exported protein [Halobacteriovorax marinus SJ]
MKLTIIILSFLGLGTIMVGCSALGTSPSKERIDKYKSSKNYNLKEEKFENRLPNIVDEMMDRNFTFGSIFNFFKSHPNRKPEKLLPEIKPDLASFLEPSKELKSIWFGHSTILLNMDSKIILVDPVFSKAASPVSFAVQRFQPPVLKLEELPKVDYILISHDHYDHLDMESIKFFKEKDIKFITPLGVGAHLEGWGISKEKIIERDWWQGAEFEGIKFIATPSQHFSGRGLMDRCKTLWASWVLQSENHNIYFSGDSGYDTHFKDIGDKYGPFDVAFIENGQYNEKWEEVHLLPKQSIQAYKDLRAKKYFPIHWGMFVLSMHTWNEPMQEIFKLSENNEVNLVVPKIGQIVNLSNDFTNEFWWRD